MRFLVLLLLTLTVSSTAYCQITGLPREQKVAIVSTIETYKAVLVEIDFTEQLLSQAREIIALLERQLGIKDDMNLNLKAQIETYNKQFKIQDKEIKKIKMESLITKGGAVVLIILSLILK